MHGSIEPQNLAKHKPKKYLKEITAKLPLDIMQLDVTKHVR